MSTELTVYIGVYLKVYMPLIAVQEKERRCSQCKGFAGGKFCPDCGAEIKFVQVVKRDDVSRIILEVFGDEDAFNIQEEDYNQGADIGGAFILGNLQTQTGFVYAGAHGETPMPKCEYNGDWAELIEALEKQKIRYAKRYGIVTYYT